MLPKMLAVLLVISTYKGTCYSLTSVSVTTAQFVVKSLASTSVCDFTEYV